MSGQILTGVGIYSDRFRLDSHNARIKSEFRKAMENMLAGEFLNPENFPGV